MFVCVSEELVSVSFCHSRCVSETLKNSEDHILSKKNQQYFLLLLGIKRPLGYHSIQDYKYDQTCNANFQYFTYFDTRFYGHISVNNRKV